MQQPNLPVTAQPNGIAARVPDCFTAIGTAGQRLVLGRVAELGKSQKRIWASARFIAGTCGMSERSVRNALNHWENTGALTRDAREGTTDIRHFTFECADTSIIIPWHIVNRIDLSPLTKLVYGCIRRRVNAVAWVRAPRQELIDTLKVSRPSLQRAINTLVSCGVLLVTPQGRETLYYTPEVLGG